MLNQMHINVTQMMVSKQWVRSWGIYRWAGEGCTYVKKVSNNRGYEEESHTLKHHFSLQQKKQVAKAENNVIHRVYSLKFKR